jgi:peptide deformylase
MKKFNPYDRYASSTDISASIILDDWHCKLVEPKHPALRTLCSLDPFASQIDWQHREKEMIQLMKDNLGVGLSAPQVGSNYNMFVMTHSVLGDIGIYKPEILEYSEQQTEIEEGCLSFPLLYVKLSRPAKVKVRYYKTDGVTQVETWMDGMDARCFLHEYDHLQGKLYIDDVSDFKLKRAKERRDKYLKKLSRKVKL